jgi:hypothetical protein
LGVYQVKVVQDPDEAAGEYQRQYEILFPEGMKRKSAVIGEEE